MAKLDNVEKRRLRNRSVRRYVKTSMVKAEAAIASGEAGASREAVSRAVSALDRAAKKGVIHPNHAARRKSRLTKKTNKVTGSRV